MKIRLLLLILFVIPFANAWNWETHQDIALSVYYSIPDEIKSNLNQNIMIEGSIIPDKIFKDYVYHSYPKSYEKAQQFLDAAFEDYNSGKYDESALNIGIATHYISDSFSSPHNIKKEDSREHSKYEDQISKTFYKLVKCEDSDKEMNDIIKEGQNTGLEWDDWLNSKDVEIPKKHISMASLASIQIVLNKFNAECSNLETKYIRKTDKKELIYQSGIALLIILMAISIIKDLIALKSFK